MPVAEGTHFIYTVGPEDTLYWIAARMGSDVRALEQVNALYPPLTDPNLIYPGQVLVVPSTLFPNKDTFYIVAWGDTLTQIAQRFSTTTTRLMEDNPYISNPNLIFPGHLIKVPGEIYIVSPGESLYSISQSMKVPLGSLITANQGRPGFSPDLIYPGYGLIIPEPAS